MSDKDPDQERLTHVVWTANGAIDIGVTEDGVLMRRHNAREATLLDGVALIEWPMMQMLIWDVRRGDFAPGYDVNAPISLCGYDSFTGYESFTLLAPLRRRELPDLLRELKAQRPVIDLAQRFMPHVSVPPMLLIDE